MNYTLRTCTQDGKILDTSREADAKIGNIFTQGRTYEPLQTVIGEHKVIRGFEYGLIGMKKGEKKIIAVAVKVSPIKITTNQPARFLIILKNGVLI